MGEVEARPALRIDRAAAIEGYMSIGELLWLAKQASRHYHIVEIGSWTGRSTRALADNTSGIVRAVDTWEGSSDGDLKDVLLLKGEYWAFDEFVKNMKDAENLRIYPLSSATASVSLKPFAPFDMVFIDGDHSYKSVRNDIMFWEPLLAPGGLLCGHDYTETRRHCAGVKKAVDEMIPNVRFMSLDDGERTIWWKPCPM
jgi:predicted O-methyltransferase YrrM